MSLVDTNSFKNKVDIWSQSGIDPAQIIQEKGQNIQFTSYEEQLIEMITDLDDDNVGIQKIKKKFVEIKKNEYQNSSSKIVQLNYWHEEKFRFTRTNFIDVIISKIIHLFSYNSCHVSLNHFNPDEKLLSWEYHGRVDEKTYAHTSRCVEILDLDLDTLFGSGITPAIKETFYKTLNEYLDTESAKKSKVTRFSIFHIFLHRKRKKVDLQHYLSENLQKMQKNEILDSNFCSSAPVILIILAHLKTCQEHNLPLPADLTHYGLYANENMANITPQRLKETFVAKNIFKTHLSAFKYVD